MATIKQLSCQSSVEPCVLEEEIATDDKHSRDSSFHTATETQVVIESNHHHNNNTSPSAQKSRPDSLILKTTTIEDSSAAVVDSKKFLYRSQSTRSFKKPKPKASKLLSSDLDQIYVISSSTRSDLNDFYDSIEVITERRSKNFMEFSNNGSENRSNSNDIHNNSSNEHENKCDERLSNEIVVQVESHTNGG
jgi:hypothetical protein